MTENSITSADPTQGVLAVALLAIAEHMVEHKLPFPFDIYPTFSDGRPGLRVAVSGTGQQQRWLNSVTIDSEVQEPTGLGRLRMAWMVRLESGIRFELVGHREGDGRSGDLALVSPQAVSS